MTDILRSHVLSRFTCLGDQCSDTCCKSWSMQVDAATIGRYQAQAPELMQAVEPATEAPWIMRKNTQGFCVKLEGGWCGVHKQYGDDFLGDACHFYPRITRSFGSAPVMTAALSCPEITRLALMEGDDSFFEIVPIERLPSMLKDYLPPELGAADAFAIHEAFLAATKNAALSPEQIFLCINNASRSLDLIAKKDWPGALTYYLQNAQKRLPAAQTNSADPFNLLHALCGLAVAVQKPVSERLQLTIAEMEQALDVTLDWKQVSIHTHEGSLKAYERMYAQWSAQAADYFAPILRRWLQAQISLALFPFSGLGHTLAERMSIIGVRLATVKLALMCGVSISNELLPEENIVRIIQSLSRFLDHLGDPAFSLKIYEETGWIHESRMRGLLEGQ